MERPASDSKKSILHYIRIALVALGILLAVLFVFLVREYFALRHMHIHRTAQELSGEVALIQSWMTFDYLNRWFRLPQDFLMNSLGIADPRYPRLTIRQYASEKGLDEAQFLQGAEAAIRNYLSGNK